MKTIPLTAVGPNYCAPIDSAPNDIGGGDMSGVFEQALDSDLDQLIDNQLRLQVEVSFKTHHDFLIRCGLAKSRTVLDFGAGNGLFTTRLAQLHPSVQFIGMDMKQGMVDHAKLYAETHGVKNIRWVKGDETQLADPSNQFDGILMRYAAMHMPNIASSLQLFSPALNDGGMLWIIDTELDHLECSPTSPAFDIYKKGMLHAFASHNVNPHIGSQLPGLLRNESYDVVAEEVDPTSNKDMGIEAYRSLVWGEVQIFNAIDKDAYTADELETIRAFLKDDASKPEHHATSGVMLIAAQKTWNNKRGRE